MRLLKNIGWAVISRIGTQGLAVVSNVLLARYLGRDGFGEYAFISSILLIGNAFTTFGMDMILIRSLASDEKSFNLADGLLLQLLLSLFYVIGVFTTELFVSVPLSLKIYIFALFPLAFFTISNIDLRARQEMKKFSFIQFVAALLQLLAVFALWTFNAGVTTFAGFMLAVHCANALFAFTYYSSRLPHWHFSLPRTFSLLKASSQMAAIGTLRLVYEKITIAILPALTGLSVTGAFSVSSRLTEAGKLGHLSAFTAMYPEMARDADFGKQMKGLRLLLGVAFLISLFIFIFAEIVIRILFGAEFILSVQSLQIMAWVIIPYVLVTYVSLGLVALGYEKPVLSSLLSALFVLLSLFFLLTPAFGISGTAFAVLSAEIVHAALLWYQWRRYVVPKSSR